MHVKYYRKWAVMILYAETMNSTTSPAFTQKISNWFRPKRYTGNGKSHNNVEKGKLAKFSMLKNNE